MLNATFDGKVEKKELREDGQFIVEIDTTCPLFKLVDLLNGSLASGNFFVS